MAKKQIVSTENKLPEDLWVEIFVSQPVKSLLRLRCVCKLWNEIITSNSFTKAHHSHQKTSPNPNKYFLLNYHASYAFVPPNMEPEPEPHTEYSRDLDYTFEGEALERFHCLQFYGICDGLLCVSEDPVCWPRSDRRVFLWNPILRKAKKLPELGPTFHRELPALCFGHYDDDYKVIGLSCSLHICFYSLSIDSWKFFKYSDGTNDTYRSNFAPYPNAKLVKGVAYFIQYSKKNGRLVSFDLNTHLVRIIGLPGEFASPANYFMEEYKESIALLWNDHVKDVVIMWVLDLSVSDNSFSWDNKFTFQVPGQQLKGFINNDNLLIRNCLLQTYYLLNIENGFRQPLTTLQGLGELEDRYLESVHYFPESLVLHTEPSVNSNNSVNSNDSTTGEHKKNKDMVMDLRKYVYFLRRSTSITSKQSQQEHCS